MRIKNCPLVLDGTDMQSSIASNPIFVGHVSDFSMQLVFTGSPNGTFTLEGSNDEGAEETRLDQASITNWTTIATQAITSSGNHMFNVSGAGYRWVRLTWTDTSSGTSAMTVYRFNGKGF